MTKRYVSTVAAVLALGAVFLPAPAQAAHDTEPPRLTTPIKAQFIRGTQLVEFTQGDEGDPFFDVPAVLKWSATDNVDPELNYDVWAHPLGDEPERIGNFITENTFNVISSDYTGFFGGEAIITDNWSVQAYDDADNSVERSIYGAQLLVTQDDNTKTAESSMRGVSVRYTGVWKVGSCDCFAAGTTHWSNTKNAAAVITVRVPAAEDLRRVALVMDTAPRRGRAQVRVDGKLKRTIDTTAEVTAHRERSVWASTSSGWSTCALPTVRASTSTPSSSTEQASSQGWP
jgi:hypothetical protein